MHPDRERLYTKRHNPGWGRGQPAATHWTQHGWQVYAHAASWTAHRARAFGESRLDIPYLEY